MFWKNMFNAYFEEIHISVGQRPPFPPGKNLHHYRVCQVVCNEVGRVESELGQQGHHELGLVGDGVQVSLENIVLT